MDMAGMPVLVASTGDRGTDISGRAHMIVVVIGLPTGLKISYGMTLTTRLLPLSAM